MCHFFVGVRAPSRALDTALNMFLLEVLAEAVRFTLFPLRFGTRQTARGSGSELPETILLVR